MRQLSAQCLCVGGSVRSSVHVGALRRRVCVCASECVCVFVSFCACGSRFYLDMLCIGQVSTWPAARGPLVSIPFAALTTMLRYPCGECWVALAVLGLGSRVCITDRTSCAACCETHRPHGWRCARCICTKRRWTMNGWVRSVRSGAPRLGLGSSSAALVIAATCIVPACTECGVACGLLNT